MRWIGDSWQRLPGRAIGIAIGPEGSVLVIAGTMREFGYSIWKWENNMDKWHKVGGQATNIAVGKGGLPYMTNKKNRIYWPEEACPASNVPDITYS